jgi:hypothetical protein
MLLYGVALVALVIFMATVGLKLAINASLFLTSIGSKPAVEEKRDEFFGSLSIDSIPSATNSAEIRVEGTVTNYDLIEIYLNDEKVEDEKFPSSDTFSVLVGDLKPGENTVYVKALEKKDKKERKSEVYIVIYKNQKPKLEVSEPANDTKTRKTEIKVAGATNSEIFIKVNGLPLVVTSDGQFQTLVQLKEGENKIIVTAEDDAGNIETKEIKVIREKDE